MTELPGHGPWARLVASAVVSDEGSSTANRGRTLLREGEVHSVGVEEGVVRGRVFGTDGQEHGATIAAAAVPERIWRAVADAARGNGALAAAVAGRAQSVHLEHLMTVEWEHPLVPPRSAIERACTCGAPQPCEHVAALAYAFSDRIDAEPSSLLRWRGCVERERPAEPVAAPAVAPPEDPWAAGELPEAGPPRPFPLGAVLARLGPSEVAVGGTELTALLRRAYAAFADER